MKIGIKLLILGIVISAPFYLTTIAYDDAGSYDQRSTTSERTTSEQERTRIHERHEQEISQAKSSTEDPTEQKKQVKSVKSTHQQEKGAFNITARIHEQIESDTKEARKLKTNLNKPSANLQDLLEQADSLLTQIDSQTDILFDKNYSATSPEAERLTKSANAMQKEVETIIEQIQRKVDAQDTSKAASGLDSALKDSDSSTTSNRSEPSEKSLFTRIFEAIFGKSDTPELDQQLRELEQLKTNFNKEITNQTKSQAELTLNSYIDQAQKRYESIDQTSLSQDSQAEALNELQATVNEYRRSYEKQFKTDTNQTKIKSITNIDNYIGKQARSLNISDKVFMNPDIERGVRWNRFKRWARTPSVK